MSPVSPNPPATLPPAPLAGIDDLRLYLRTTGATGSAAGIDDALLERLIAAASRRLQRARPERTLAPTPAAGGEPVEVRFPLVAPTRIVQVPDLREVVTVTVNGADLPTSGYSLRGRPHEATALWLKLTTPAIADGELTIVGHWGPPEVDDDVREAVVVWAARAFHNRTARYADTVQSPDGGVASYFRNLPPDVKLLVDALEVPGL